VSVLVIVALLKMLLGVWEKPAASLGEVALREAVRRQAMNASLRKLTDADIGPAPARPPAPKPPATATAGSAAEEGKPGEKPPEPVKDETWWRARITAARAALERDKLLVDALDNRVSTLTRDAVNRDDPVQRAALIQERLRALEELETMRKQVAADTQAIADIEEEARKAGIPPGWIRLN
jgi:hypothetical protein